MLLKKGDKTNCENLLWKFPAQRVYKIFARIIEATTFPPLVQDEEDRDQDGLANSWKT